MGFFRLLGKATFYAGIFVAVHSIHSCIKEDSSYDIRRYAEIPYLLDKKADKIVEIVNENGKLHLGDIEYLIDSGLDKSRIDEYVRSLRLKLEVK